ncbi:MAG: hypothetical protein EA367_12905 [Leptolyngbya sp. DLM2.Bin15]|nr:MAG: hypothetical protein EA367_12905 [Leptolyngbya sp. DLM2.Bin15]
MAGLTAERSLKGWLMGRAYRRNGIPIKHLCTLAHVQTFVVYNLGHSLLDHSIHGPASNLILDGNSLQRNHLVSQTRVDLGMNRAYPRHA